MRFSLFRNSYSPLDYLFLTVWVKFTLLDYLRVLIMHIPIINSLSNYVIPSIIIIVTLLASKCLVKTIKPVDVLLYIAFISIYLVNYIIYPQNTCFLDETTMPFIFSTIPYFFVGRIINYERVAKPLNLLSIISVLCFAFLYFTRSAGEDSGESGSGMHAAYMLLPFIIVLFANIFTEKKLFPILIGLFSFFMLLSFGNRGAVLYLLIYIVFCLLNTLKSKNKRSIALILSILFIFPIYYYFDLIIMGLYNIMDGLGLSVRIFEKIIEGDIADSSGRDIIVSQLLGALKNQPMGLGLLGDRAIVGVYAHNIFIELLVSFGYFLGSIISVLLITIIVTAFKKSRNSNIHLFYVGAICFGFLPLLTSHSFLSYPNFWLFLGYTIQILTNDSLENNNGK